MRIRKIEIENFRSIKKLSWFPADGINCLIGHGDSGKSTILDAIDYCLSARRALQFYDSDFYNLDVSKQISITLTVGDLDDNLKNLDSYSNFLRGFNKESFTVEDEPGISLENVLTINLKIGNELEPSWSLYSDRSAEQGYTRNLSWADRVRISPARIGALASYNLSWRYGSVLNKLAEEKYDGSSALVNAARKARESFGVDVEKQFQETLAIVSAAAAKLGVNIGSAVHAHLDAHSVNIGEGSIALHDGNGVPLRSLGTGSTRLLVAGLQKKSVDKTSLLLVDEVEYGLEPHRIIQFLSTLGANEKQPTFQAFLTTHSPVVLRELSGNQLFIVQNHSDSHLIISVGDTEEAQSTIRSYPEAFLSKSIIVCEGASEVGLIRGINIHRQTIGQDSIFSHGTTLVNAGGINQAFDRAVALQSLGYRVSIFCDDDVHTRQAKEAEFTKSGGLVFKWKDGKHLEDILFMNLPDIAVAQLVDYACNLFGEELVNEHISSVSNNTLSLENIPEVDSVETIPSAHKLVLAKASCTKRNSWFKTVSIMEEIGRNIVSPNLEHSEQVLRSKMVRLFKWASNEI